jgi:beta-galactosidase
LLRPDSGDDQGALEARQASGDIAKIGRVSETPKSVALLFSYEAAWLFETQPQGQDFRYIELAFETYSALRKLGLDVDIIAPEASFSDYKMIVAPSLPILTDALVERLANSTVPVLIGPRSGSKTADFAIPSELPPGPLQSVVPIKVTRVESLRPGLSRGENGANITRWFEHIETALTPDIELEDGTAMVFSNGNFRYLAAWPGSEFLLALLKRMTAKAKLDVVDLPQDIRIRKLGRICFAFNYGQQSISLSDFFAGAQNFEFIVGSNQLEAAGVCAWTLPR